MLTQLLIVVLVMQSMEHFEFGMNSLVVAMAHAAAVACDCLGYLAYNRRHLPGTPSSLLPIYGHNCPVLFSVLFDLL